MHKFILVTPDRLYYLCAESRTELEQWFQALCEVRLPAPYSRKK